LFCTPIRAIRSISLEAHKESGSWCPIANHPGCGTLGIGQNGNRKSPEKLCDAKLLVVHTDVELASGPFRGARKDATGRIAALDLPHLWGI